MSEIPLELAELLHVTLGPLHQRLEQEGHSWAPMIGAVLETYQRGRDEYVGDGDIVNTALDRAVDQVDAIIAQLTSEEEDFSLWESEAGKTHP